jgi:hypothetical protein
VSQVRAENASTGLTSAFKQGPGGGASALSGKLGQSERRRDWLTVDRQFRTKSNKSFTAQADK